MNSYGLNEVYDYYEIELDSLDNDIAYRAGVAATDWPTFDIGGRAPITSVAACKVLSFEATANYYVFTAENSTFQVSYDGGAFTNVTITMGNYNTTTICTELTTQLTAATGQTFTVTYDTRRQQLYFVVAAGHVFTFRFGGNTDYGNTNPRLWIGFAAGDTSSAGNFLYSSNCIQLSGPNYLYLNSSRFGSNTSIFLPKGAINLSGGNMGPQLAKIPVNANSGDTIYYSDPDPQKWFSCGGASLMELDLYCTMGNVSSQTPLRWNGTGFSLKLGILIKKMSNDEEYSGLIGSGRITKRIRPY